MSIRVTVNLILDDEAGDEMEKAPKDEEGVVAKYIKRLANKDIEHIKLRIVDIEDIW